jgi:3-methyladenine DNA glycosylase AlkD
MNIENIINEIKSLSNKKYADHHSKFFKTGKGEYGEGDLFYGLKVPEIRNITKKYYKLINLKEIDSLIKNAFHEIRLTALIILVLKYPKSSQKEQEQIFNLYIDNVKYINNWDLVDLSAPNIVGNFLYNKNYEILYNLAQSGYLWSERISVIATFYFIKQGEYSHTVKLAEYFLTHKHDLMHKAAGWMLREVGKRDIDELYSFLDKFHKTMPRTMLRYSIEKLSPEKRAFYMKK